MTILRAPGLGPIVGETTDTTCRIWIRAQDIDDPSDRANSFRRTVGVIGIVIEDPKDPKNNKVGDAWYFRLPREFDRTGTFKLGYDVPLGRFGDDARRERIVEGRAPRAETGDPLKPDTPYVVRLGTLTLDDPLPDEANLPDFRLRDRLPDLDKIKNELLDLPAAASEARFCTLPPGSKIQEKMSFLLGSCRYPPNVLTIFHTKQADEVFGGMCQHFAKDNNPFGTPARFTMMCGDQIYADQLNKFPVGKADTYREFRNRYHEAFGAPNLKRLLRTSTTYMALDDHEIEDNWTQDKLKSNHELFNTALQAYLNYQWSHGPRTWGLALYYKFDCCGYPFFVLDTRTQRFRDRESGLRDNNLLGPPTIDPHHPGQLDELKRWLGDQQSARGNVPKFIVTSSVFVPNDMTERVEPVSGDAPLSPEAAAKSDEALVFFANQKRRENSDSWAAYPSTRVELLKHILDKKIQNVVFLSGDIHCSNVAEIEFEQQEGNKTKLLPLKAFSITSSAFYWPFPIADGNPNSYVHESRDPQQWDPFPIVGTGVTMHYRSFGYTQEDNFTRIDIDQKSHTLQVRVFDDEGMPVVVTEGKRKKALANVLTLAEWTT